VGVTFGRARAGGKALLAGRDCLGGAANRRWQVPLFQLPAWCGQGLVLVISPWLALMQTGDQCGGRGSAACLHGGRDTARANHACTARIEGQCCGCSTSLGAAAREHPPDAGREVLEQGSLVSGVDEGGPN